MRRAKPSTPTIIEIDGIQIELTRKAIKNVYLRVSNPDGQVRMSAPVKMPEKAIVAFVREHRDWIAQRQARMANLPQAPVLHYVTGELHPVFGQPCRLIVIEGASRASVRLLPGDVIELSVRSGADRDKRAAVLESWYRSELATPDTRADREVGTGHGRAGRRVGSQADADQMGHLQHPGKAHLAQPRTCQETPAVPGIRRCPRNEPLAWSAATPNAITHSWTAGCPTGSVGGTN